MNLSTRSGKKVAALLVLLGIFSVPFFRRAVFSKSPDRGKAGTEVDGHPIEASGQACRAYTKPDYKHAVPDVDSVGRKALSQTLGDARAGISLDVALENVSSSVALITRLNGQHDPMSLIYEEAFGLSGGFSRPDTLALLEFLRAPYSGALREHHNTIRNRILLLLLEERKIQPEVPVVMMEMLLSESLDNGWRDYVLQFMPRLLSRFRAGEVLAPDLALFPHLYESLLDAWWSATALRDGSLAGAALLGMSRYTAVDPENVPPDAVRDMALDVAEDRMASDMSRIHALQVAANLGDDRVLPLARSLAGHGSPALRRSAIAALGALGEEEDIERIQRLTENADLYEMLRPAIDGALARLQDQVDEVP